MLWSNHTFAISSRHQLKCLLSDFQDVWNSGSGPLLVGKEALMEVIRYCSNNTPPPVCCQLLNSPTTNKSQQQTKKNKENIARVQNCPDVTIFNSLFGLCHLSFCLFLFIFLSFCLFVFLSFWLFVFLYFFVCLSRHQIGWSNVWVVSSFKSHNLCRNCKVAVTDWLTDQGQV